MRQTFTPVSQPVHATVTVPGSKSISNRALIIAALAQGQSILRGLLLSDDTMACLTGLQALGVNIELDPSTHTAHIQGSGGQFIYDKAEIYCHESGTMTRFILPACAATHGQYHVFAAPRMMQRPLANLLDCLTQQGATFTYDHAEKSMPLTLHAEGLQGGKVTVALNESSQFLSGLLMTAPYAKQPLTLVSGDLSKKPYVHMTLAMMKAFGIEVEQYDSNAQSHLSVQQGVYQALDYQIEPDASTASYFFAMAALTGGEVTVPGLTRQALQGDVRFLSVLEQMGCQVSEHAQSITVKGPQQLQGLGTFSMSGFSDTFMTLAVCAVFAGQPTTLTGLTHTRLQESDRVDAMASELRKCGVQVETTQDSLTITPSEPHGAEVFGHNDHRIAMSLSLLGLKVPGMAVEGAECVAKTCPNYYELYQQASAC